MNKLLKETTSLWEHLKLTTKPIYIYGMGDGAVKILDVLEQLGVKAAGIYASDSFVRGHSFRDYKVVHFADVKQECEQFISLLAFAAFREPMLDVLYDMQNECEFYAPDVPVCKVDDCLFDINYVNEHQNDLLQVHSLLCDSWSKKVLTDTLNFKVSGKIDYLKRITSAISEVYVDLIAPKPTDVYVDLGAYNGDTVSEMLTFTGAPLAKIIALEPDRRNFIRLQKRIQSEQIENIIAYQLGAWSCEETLHFSGGKGGRNSKLADNGSIDVSANSVDNLLNGARADIIKLDVEGAEMQALRGCEKTIKAYKPRLMISAYHKNEDLFAIPLYINSLNLGYKIYLRHHPYIPSWETNFYCI